MRTKKLLLLAIALGLILRIAFVATNPPHLTPDEAALGYNAYSILKTGRDEYGNLLPVVFKSFGDYKPGLYVYLTVPFVAVFGLNELAVRLPSVLFGTFAIYLIYLIAKRLFPENKHLPVVSAFLLAICPWHMHFSRGAWEITVSLTLSLLGIIFFFESFEKPKKIILSSFFFALTYITYQGAKLSTTIILFLLLVFYFKKVKRLFTKNKKEATLAVFLGFVICAPIILSLFGGRTGRLEVFSLFSYPRPEGYVQNILDQGGEKLGSPGYYLFHSEPLSFTRALLGRWFNHVSSRFLYFIGDWQNPRHSAPYSGMFLVGDLVLVLLGLYAMIRNFSKGKKFVLAWAILAPLPAVLTRDQVQAVRSFNMLVPLVLINAAGFVFLVEWLRKNKKVGKAFAGIFALFYLSSFAYFLDQYFVHLPENDAEYWNYGYKTVVDEVSKIKDEYDIVKVQQSYNQPYIYFLFYQKYEPSKYQEQAELSESPVGDVGLVGKLDNISFEELNLPFKREGKKSLLVGDTIKISDEIVKREDITLLKQITYPDGKVAFRIIKAE